MGTPENNKVESVAGCVGCHSQANESDDYTFPPANHNMMDENKVFQDFLGYETSPAWTLVDTTIGQDTAGTLSGGKHGFDKNLFRKTYKKQLGPKINGEYPAGTIFLKELSMPDTTDNTKAGSIMGPLTIMVKRSSGSASTNNWEYFMTDANRTKIVVQGQLNNLSANPENNVSGCISCHSIAQTRDSNNDFIFKKSVEVIKPIPSTQIDAVAVIQRAGCSAIFCHGEKLTGVGGNGFNLSILTNVYIKDELTKFKNGERAGGTMPGIAGGLSEEEIDALADYIPTIQ
jgi:cytochrome c553